MRLRRTKKRARVEMLPLMDVVFLLLVFFIYSMMSMAVHRAMPLNLPSSSQAEIDRGVSLALSINADGSIYLDKEPVEEQNLTDALRAKILAAEAPGGNEPESQAGTPHDGAERGENAKTSTDVSLQVFADGSLSYQKIYTILDRIKAAGIKKITLQAQGMGEQSEQGTQPEDAARILAPHGRTEQNSASARPDLHGASSAKPGASGAAQTTAP